MNMQTLHRAAHAAPVRAVERVVIVNDTSVNNGGAAALALLAARGLRSTGQRVSFLTGDAGENNDLVALGIDVHGAGGASLLERGKGSAAVTGIYDKEKARFVAEFIAREDTPRTVYHVHAWAQIFSPSLFDALAPVASRVFIHAHDMFLACPNGVYMNYQRGEVCGQRPMSLGCMTTHCDKRALLHKAWRLARQASIRRAFLGRDWGGVFQIHPGMRERLERGGIPADMIKTLRNPAEAYSETRVRAEENQGFLYVGRLEEDKGVRLLAEAAAEAGQHVTFVGDGAMRAELETRFPQFTLAGWCNRDQIGAYARRARALVMPSAHPEPFALVLPEAIQSGLPVLVSDSALMAEEIEVAGLGVAFKAGEHAGLVAAMTHLSLMDNKLVNSMSCAGFAEATRLATRVEEWTQGMLSAYRDAV